jgi:PKD repeat protein
MIKGIRLPVLLLFLFHASLAHACPGAAHFNFISPWCQGAAVNFNNTSTGAASGYVWIWGDATANTASATTASQTHTFATAGTYTVALVRNFANGCNDTLRKTIQIVNTPPPAPSFTFVPGGGCSTLPFHFTNTTGNGGLSYSWDFGDPSGIPNSSTSNTPTHLFSAVGNGGLTTYTVSLTASSAIGCQTSTTQIISVKNRPNAALADSNIFSPFNNCGNATVSNPAYYIALQNTSSTQASNTNYNLNWGDGSAVVNSATFTQISHTYASLGLYNVVLIVTGSNGCTDTMKQKIVNQTNPSVGLTGPGATSGCAPQSFTFTLTPDNNNINFTTYTFYFGDNSPSITMSPPIPSPATVTHVFSTTSCGQPGNQFTVKVTAHNDCDSTTATVNNIKISAKPLALFTASPNPGCVNVPITFSNTTTAGCFITGGTTNANASYTWNFGDGTPNVVTPSSAGQSHAYPATGSYTVTLSAANPCGSSTYSLIERIIGPPVALFTHTPPACAPVTIHTTNLSTTDSLTYNWQAIPAAGWVFSGGTTAQSTNAQFDFTSAGTYTIQLTTSNPCGVSTDTSIITVHEKPIVILAPIPNACGISTITPSATYLANGDPISTFSWDFTGGTPASSAIAVPGSVVYSIAGHYTVSITATNACGSASTSQTFTAAPAPGANAGHDTTICQGQNAKIGSPAIAGLSYSWSSNPAGFTSASATNSVAAASTTSYFLTVTDGNNCVGKDTVLVTVTPMPVVSAGTAQTVCISNAAFNLSGTPAGGSWTGTGITNAAAGTFSPILAGAGTFTLTYSVTGAGCPGTGTVPITVAPLPVVDAGNGTIYCNQPGTATLSGFTPAGGSWSGTAVTSGGVFTPSTAGTGNFILTYSFTDANSCSSQDTINVAVVNPSVVLAGKNDTLCVNSGALTLAGFSPAGGSWSGTGISNPSGQFDPTVSGAGIFPVTYNYGTGTCAGSATKNVVVNALPVVNAGANQILCANNPVFNLSGFSPAGGSWSGTGITNAASGTFDPATSGSGTFVLTYSFTDPASHCSNTASKQITVNPLPVVNAGTGTVFCNQPIPVTLTGFTPAGGTWTGTGVSAGGIFNPSVAGNGLTILTYSLTDANSCSNSDTIQVTVVTPAVAVAGKNDTICINSGIFTLSGFSPAGGAWSGTGITNPATGTFDPLSSGAGSHTLSYTYGAGTCQNASTKIVFVQPVPIVSAGPNETICISTPAYNLSGFSPAGGTWSGTGISNAATGLFNPANAGAGIFTLTYSFTNAVTHCTSIATKTITVGALPVVQFTNPSPGCIGVAVPFTDNTTGAGTYAWKFGDGANATTQQVSHIYGAAGTYTIHLIATSPLGCKDSNSSTIQILQMPVALFSTSPVSGCAPLTVNFTDQSTLATGTMNWNLGNGQSSTLSTPPAQTYTQGINDTVYYIVLTVQNQCATSIHKDSVIVHPIPEAGFGTNLSSGCSPAKFTFHNTTTGKPISFSWDFGDGTSGTGPLPPAHTYTYTGKTDSVYQIQMIVSNACGSDTAYAQVTVFPNTVKSFFNTSSVSGCLPHSVTFTDFSTGGTNTTWNFGDGNISSLNSPTHVYTTAGTYTVSQFVTNGCSYDTSHIVITVHPNAGLVFSANPVPGCVNHPVSFTNTSTNVSGFVWHFGDGTNSIVNSPTHVFTSGGTFTVTLVGTSTTFACVDSISHVITETPLPVPVFVPTNTFGCAPLLDSFINTSTKASFYNWRFGDGNTSVLPAPTHVYTNAGTYTVLLTAQSAAGCTDSVKQIIQVHPVPKAGFSQSSKLSCVFPVTVNFTNTSTGATGYAWDFGNTQTSANVNGTTSYVANGTYTIRLTVSNSFGCTDSAKGNVGVFPKPVVLFSPDITTGCQPLHVVFTNQSEPGTSYSWAFGDGGQSTQISPVYVYSTVGAYNVVLVATSAAGCKDSSKLGGLITVNPRPEATFSYIQQFAAGIPNGTISFINSSTGSTTSFWTFGDGASGTDADPVHQYPAIGDYMATLIADNSFGCTDTSELKIAVDYFQGLFVPNAFIPGSSFGEASVFKPKGKSMKQYHIQIFNTWGTLVWESTSLDADGSPTEGWDGMYQGKPCKQDAYVWKVDAVFDNGSTWAGKKYPNGQVKNTGTVTLIR